MSHGRPCRRRSRALFRQQHRPHLPRRRAPRISPRYHRSRHREGHLALACQAHRRDGARWRARRSFRPDREGRQDRVRFARGPARARIDPPRRRACAGRSGADAVARHAGHHRAGDRERLLLRFLPQRAVHAGGLPGDREEDARDHRARQTVHQAGMGPREDQAGLPRQGRDVQGRAGRRDPRQRADQDLSPGRLVRPLPRPAHDERSARSEAPSS